MLNVICIGGGTRDIFFDVDGLTLKKANKNIKEKVLEIPYGAKIIAKNTYYTYGGGAVNNSVCLSKLGLKSAAFCNIGAEGTGSLLAKELKNEKVNVSLISRDYQHHTGLSVFVLGKDGDHTAFLERGANDFLKIQRKSSLKRTKWLYISSLTGNSGELLPELFTLAEKSRIKIAFNPGSQQLEKGYDYLKDFIEKAEILNLNLEEAEILVASKLKRAPKNEDEIISELEKMGATITVVTKGKDGSKAIFEGNVYIQKSFSEKVADTTGAGDAFGATFLFGIIKGFDIRYCLKIAAINSASVVTKIGAHPGLLTYNSIRSSKWL